MIDPGNEEGHAHAILSRLVFPKVHLMIQSYIIRLEYSLHIHIQTISFVPSSIYGDLVLPRAEVLFRLVDPPRNAVLPCLVLASISVMSTYTLDTGPL